jgi:hypothetical protein
MMPQPIPVPTLTKNADDDRPYVVGVAAYVGEQIGQILIDPGEDVGGVLVDVDVAVQGVEFASGEVAHCQPGVGRAQVGGQDQCGVGIEVQEHAWAAAAGH